MAQPLRILAEHLFDIWQEELINKSSALSAADTMGETIEKIKRSFNLIPPSQQDAWIRVAREVCMEAEALSQIKKLL